MARIKLSTELKKAISLLPDKEKNKLLYRLIAKDDLLVEQLEFRLLEMGESKELRREELEETIRKRLMQCSKHFYSPGYLLLDVRSLSGMINRHVRVAKDKYGEVELNFLLLNYSLELMGQKIRRFSYSKGRTFNTYVVKRAMKLLRLLRKMHEDLVLDFQPSMEELSVHMKQQPNMVKIANDLGLDLDSLNAQSL